MKGLSVRWPLAQAPSGAEQELRDYVADSSHARFSGMSGLRFKTWRMREGEWFEGTYVFVSDEARAEFEAGFRPGADDSPVSKIVGAGPESIEPFEVVAIAEGWDGFSSSARG
ncbi:hypothetical protein [Nocardioides daphniae]|uniref:Uncharacterized protein n=1 Tax=Nocardioides daphniae TaxID=402297 RepID=A0A4P7U956_9ACTN|nr:hypothetical protein [Nocardioides daphniae]QCC76683.1 hypothetical protein E2C04_04650 [Nocardioides daphniae]GGD15291.1 hypothetical protein GCM10007231_12880 [Nocardioides daphniae]